MDLRAIQRAPLPAMHAFAAAKPVATAPNFGQRVASTFVTGFEKVKAFAVAVFRAVANFFTVTIPTFVRAHKAASIGALVAVIVASIVGGVIAVARNREAPVAVVPAAEVAVAEAAPAEAAPAEAAVVEVAAEPAVEVAAAPVAAKKGRRKAPVVATSPTSSEASEVAASPKATKRAAKATA